MKNPTPSNSDIRQHNMSVFISTLAELYLNMKFKYCPTFLGLAENGLMSGILSCGRIFRRDFSLLTIMIVIIRYRNVKIQATAKYGSILEVSTTYPCGARKIPWLRTQKFPKMGGRKSAHFRFSRRERTHDFTCACAHLSPLKFLLAFHCPVDFHPHR